MKNHYDFHKNLIVRTPALPFQAENISETKLKEICAEKWFQEAIYLASPDLHRMSLDWIEGKVFEKKKEQKLIVSLSKYYSRMMSRCTPYGLFAGCSQVAWAETDEIIFDDNSEIRHTRFDMHFLGALAAELSKISVIKENLIYYPNTSIYQAGQELRYIEYEYKNTQRSYQISAVSDSEYLQLILQKAQEGIHYQSIIKLIDDAEISSTEVCAFIDQLIEAQLLVSELEPSITGGSFTQQIIDVIERIYIQTSDTQLKSIFNYLNLNQNLLKNLDNQAINTIADYQEIITNIQKLGIDFEENKLFQTDLFRSPIIGKVNQNWQNELTEALNVLNCLSVNKEKKSLKEFANRFSERYETQEIPLLEALDAEMGLGYHKQSNTNSLTPLVEGIIPPSTETNKNTTWNIVENWLFGKLQENLKSKNFSITINEQDLKQLPEQTWADLPPSIATMFRIVNTEQKGSMLFIESCGSSSAINLLGRFAHENNEIFETAKAVAELEQEQNPDVIFAEIIHLPENRTGNILLHPAFREYEISFLGKSSLPQNQQISLQDLYVSVRNGQILLRSKRLNKIVIPRLSNAHNYSLSSLPIYQFLCDLQFQNLRTGLGFSWGSLAEKFKFLPRIIYKNTVLSTATWNLHKDDTIKIINGQLEDFQFPRLMVLADGDNQLLIDWENPLSISTLIDTIKNRDTYQLREFLHDFANPIAKNINNQGFINEFIALHIKQSNTYLARKTTQKSESIQRGFSIGSEWLYFKLYGGVKSADKILSDYINPLVQKLQNENLIDQWFFIRYSDPDNHLRLRFHLPDTTCIGEIIGYFYSFTNSAIQEKYLWKIQTDTYVRELERYGQANINLAEKLFYFDSEAILAFLSCTEGDEREHLRWLWGIKAIDKLLHDFEVSLPQRLYLMEVLKTKFGQEFGMNISFKQQLDKKYRDERKAIQEVLCGDVESEILPVILTEILEEKSLASAAAIEEILHLNQDNQLNISLLDLLASHIHMLINRLIPSNQRLHELLMYDFLYRHYLSEHKMQTRVLHKEEAIEA